ncbi:MAG: hypothetical protein Q9227_006529 [Pyrenula ochraceoflavens]
MYAALASGDSAALGRMCCDGLAKNLRNLVARRTGSVQRNWELVKYNGFDSLPWPKSIDPNERVTALSSQTGDWAKGPRWLEWMKEMIMPLPARALWNGLMPLRNQVISDRVMSVPGLGREYMIRQVVVRIRSSQRLSGPTADGVAMEGARLKDLDEYVMIQRILMEGKWEPWMIWGTMQEADRASVDSFLSRGWTGTRMPPQEGQPGRVGLWRSIWYRARSMMPI